MTQTCHLLSVGDLHWSMGYDYLLAAYARLHAAGKPFTAEIIGSGSLQSEIRFSIGDLGLENRVKLTLKMPSEALSDALKNADIYVLSSHRDVIRPPLITAMANGKPIVAASFEGLEKAIHDGIEGYITPARDVSALAERLADLIDHPAKRTTMGNAARERAAELANQLL